MEELGRWEAGLPTCQFCTQSSDSPSTALHWVLIAWWEEFLLVPFRGGEARGKPDAVLGGGLVCVSVLSTVLSPRWQNVPECLCLMN